MTSNLLQHFLYDYFLIQVTTVKKKNLALPCISYSPTTTIIFVMIKILCLAAHHFHQKILLLHPVYGIGVCESAFRRNVNELTAVKLPEIVTQDLITEPTALFSHSNGRLVFSAMASSGPVLRIIRGYVALHPGSAYRDQHATFLTSGSQLEIWFRWRGTSRLYYPHQHQ